MSVVADGVSVCRYQRRLAWAADLLRRQGQEESTVRRVLSEYTKPLKHPNRESRTEGQPSAGLTAGTAGTGGLPGMEGASRASEETAEPSPGSGPGPLAACSPREYTGEDPAPAPGGPSCAQDALGPRCGLQPVDDSLPGGERGPGPEFVLVEERVSGESEGEAAPAEEVRRGREGSGTRCCVLFVASVTTAQRGICPDCFKRGHTLVTFVAVYCYSCSVLLLLVIVNLLMSLIFKLNLKCA